MRVAAIVLAIPLLALAHGTRAAEVAPPPHAPPVPVMNPPEPGLAHHLAEWEKATARGKNMRAEISLKRTDAFLKKEREYTGTVLWMKPNLGVLRLDDTRDKTDYEAYICDGKTLYAYSGRDKTITPIKLPQKEDLARLRGSESSVSGIIKGMRGADANDTKVVADLKGRIGLFWIAAVNNAKERIELLLGMKDVKDLKERFDISLFKTDENYIYLDLKPRRPADRRELTQLRMALYGPGPATAKVAYLPAQVFMLKSNGDSETWTFRNVRTNIPGVTEKNFAFVPIEGWIVDKAPVPDEPELREPEKP